MNEGLAVFLNLDERQFEENEAFIRKMDELLLDFGIKYTGVNNIYRPIEEKERDHVVFTACRALEDTDWLKDKLTCISVINQIDACPMNRIQIGHMSTPSVTKLEYYERYYQKSHTLAHGIVIDENRQLRDGYTSYIIAQKYGLCPDTYEAFANQPIKKIVKGQHIFSDGSTWKMKSNKIYIWNYSLKSPVVPGDILKVQAKKGEAFICVREIAYVSGREFCKEHRNVIKHTRLSLPFVG